ncbi:hypothetical protein O0I10_000706 [Lichtheimia ornata]|uniref:Pre-rrna processing protein n=1 Tax=Lichtheimia ornata TaxID=688661 RepID=A0AAD8DIP0_9FUNG|nr:uncharacterized protein O0I10_000706 [Lichtheimia ornata]KAJ8663466.1 hypothetical protein O0I10_000706 [Lichtheimia ornata]
MEQQVPQQQQQSYQYEQHVTTTTEQQHYAPQLQQDVPRVADDSEYYARHNGANSVNNSVEEGVMEEYSEKPPPPPRRRFYKQKKYWIICSILTVIIVVVVVLLIIFVFFPMIAQSIMNKASIGVDSAGITFEPPKDDLAKRQDFNMNTTFYMDMESTLHNTGPFSADIKFHNPINVYYNESILLGTVTLPDTHVSGGSGKLQAVTPFMIQDADVFAEFAKEMLAKEEFVWKMKGKLDISALSRTATVDLDKDIVLKGMNGFPEVKITSFNLPADAPEGGIQVELGTQLVSPSPIGVQLGTIALQIGYEGVVLGQVTTDGVNLKQGPNDLNLKGTIVPQSDPANLDKIGALFSNYVSGKMSTTSATGVSCAPDGTNAIGWLSEGFQSVRLNVGLGLDEPLSIIKAVNMGYLDLAFNADAPYAPVTTAPAVVADYSIPFGFSLNITEVSQELKLGTNESGDFASISVPFVPAQSDQAAGKLQFAMNQVAISALENKEPQFNDFTYALTASDLYTFQVGGQASTKTSTPIGNITLSGITFKVPTSLHGLQFLNSTPTTVNSVDVVGGTSDALQLAINVTMDNPSDFTISTGDVNFAFLASGEQLGNVQLSNLTLARGSNSKSAVSTFDPKKSPVGQNLLSSFVMGKNNDVSISGFDGSTNIASLASGLGAINIGTTLPGLTSQLIQGGKLTVNEDSPSNGIVGVQVSIANPFTAGLTITSVKSSASYHGMPVGNIDQDVSSNPIVIGGHSTVQSDPLQMSMNIEPAAVALLLRTLAVDANLDTNALDALFSMGGLSVSGQKDIDPSANLFDGFNISTYVMDAMKALKADLQLKSGLTIGEYVNSLEFSQNAVAIETDATVTRLIPIVGQPIVQQIVDGAILGFETITLSSPTDSSFKVQMKGSITNAGPMAAQISFPDSLTIAWEGRVLGTVGMPTIQTVADKGAQFDVEGQFTVTDQGAMGDFAGYMINNADFQWNIYTDSVAVNALGYQFTGIKMNKFVTLDGANGFKDAVTIHSFDLPSNDPAGGITLTANTSIVNPSQVGFQLSGAGFNAIYKDISLGPLASDGAANFPPKGTADLKMKGRLVKQDSKEGIDAVTEVFKNYLAAKDTPLTITGESGSGPNGEVSWLTAGFKTIKIENVIMPGPESPPELIPAITMKNMQIDFTKDPYATPAGSTQVEAQLKNPFGFPLGVSQLNMDVTAGMEGNDIATLKIPDEKATTSETGLVTTQFSDVPFKVFDNAHKAFDTFVKMITSQSNVTFELAGSSNAIADTAIGALSLDNITFDVDTSLAGFNNFNGKTQILSTKVIGATSDYIKVGLEISLDNPSQITINLGDITLDVNMNEFNALVGQTILKDLTLKPGNNTLSCEMHMGGSNAQALLQLLSNYMTGAHVPLTVTGSDKSTEIASLKDAMSTVKLDTSMTGQTEKLIQSATVKAKAIEALAGKAKTSIVLHNPLDTEFALRKVEAAVFMNLKDKYQQIGHIDYSLPSALTVPAGGQVTTDDWPVTLDASPLDMLSLIGKDGLTIDLTQNATITVGDGFNAVLYYYQNQVPMTLDFQLLGFTIPGGPGGNADNSTSSLPASEAASSTPVSSEAPSSSGDSSNNASGSDSQPTPTPTSDNADDAESSSSSSDDSSADATKESEKPEPSSTDDKASSSSDATTTEEPSSQSSDDNSSSDKHDGIGWLFPFKLA